MIRFVENYSPYVAGETATFAPHVEAKLCESGLAVDVTGIRSVSAPASHRAVLSGENRSTGPDYSALRAALAADSHRELGAALKALDQEVPSTKAARVELAERLLAE